ncbi:hypothetical protein HII31_01093 [Pseudocercospora fuligena]|uniref:Aminoglycoside phosphotransferase domain-containing protein n=1 Tax=Pseudocercospora fuligena TaxID=685502 RepID=A0A8H6VMT6_9PEZI|nr:hypothetical protein HII31_01093 [Pseudocercospora fuligena]
MERNRFIRNPRMYWRDEWPTTKDGREYDGLKLLELVRAGESPFADVWNVNLLIREIEENVDAEIIDIPLVNGGSNNYGFQMKLSNGQEIVARLARGDVNMPDFDGFSLQSQIAEVKFEAAVYEMLRDEEAIKASRLLYYRAPAQCGDDKPSIPQNIVGRRLMVFERKEGRTAGIWREMSQEQQFDVLSQAAVIRAALFKFDLPFQFFTQHLRDRLFEQQPDAFPVPVAPTRDFCVAMFTSKVEATIRNIGDMIGWESDNNTVGPIAFAAKQSLLNLIPNILPEEDSSHACLYRLVLDHGDFGIHNMTIDERPKITSLFDWETGSIVPAILSDTNMSVAGADLIIDESGRPALTRLSSKASEAERVQHVSCTEHYHRALFEQVPDYQRAVEAGLDARRLWFALRDWRGDDPEDYFGALGAWAEKRLKEI